MAKIILVAETGSDIPPEIARQNGIYIVPMHVTFGDTARDDGTFPPEEVCSYYERTGSLPKTSGSTPEDFSRAFDAIHARWPEAHILHLAYSAVTTCSYQSAKIAAADRDYVTSVDTKSVSAGQCAVVLRMAKLLEQHPEWMPAQAAAAAKEVSASVRMCFIPHDMEYLRAGGRVSNAVALCGKLLGLHPLIEIQDGRLLATQKLRGNLKLLAAKLTADYTAANRLKKDELWLIWTPGLSGEIKAAAEQSARSCGYKKITWLKTGGVVTAHGGPSCFGVAGFAEN